MMKMMAPVLVQWCNGEDVVRVLVLELGYEPTGCAFVPVHKQVLHAHTKCTMVHPMLLLLGDSDIAYWPRELLPDVTAFYNCEETSSPTIIVKGFPGGTLEDVTSALRKYMVSLSMDVSTTACTCTGTSNETVEALLVIACAGENDIGQGISLDTSVSSLERFLDILFLTDDTSTGSCCTKRNLVHLIFLGPKFEPWLEDDPVYKKKYSAMSRSFARCCRRHKYSDHIEYIDCLTMFCGVSAGLPGATLAGKACAEDNYFSDDRLHLSTEGYRLWKEIIETKLKERQPVFSPP